MDCLEFTEPWGCHFVYSLTPTKENVTKTLIHQFVEDVNSLIRGTHEFHVN